MPSTDAARSIVFLAVNRYRDPPTQGVLACYIAQRRS